MLRVECRLSWHAYKPLTSEVRRGCSPPPRAQAASCKCASLPLGSPSAVGPLASSAATTPKQRSHYTRAEAGRSLQFTAAQPDQQPQGPAGSVRCFGCMQNKSLAVLTCFVPTLQRTCFEILCNSMYFHELHRIASTNVVLIQVTCFTRVEMAGRPI